MSYLHLLYISTVFAIGFTKLFEPVVVDIISKTSYHFSIEYCEFSVPPYITTMNAHCYCFFDLRSDTSSNCSIPGPTFIFHPGDKISMTWHNRLTGANTSDPIYHNQFKDLDITNIHTHGLHISPYEDDTFLQISPGYSRTYIYKVPYDHYPGTHWIHAHHHGSSSFQITSGLFSALLVEFDQHTNRSYIDTMLSSMEENLLIFHWYYVIETSLCDCDSDAWQTYFYYPPAFDVEDCVAGKDCYPIFSFCYEYCAMPAIQRSLSGFTYHMQSDYLDNFQLFLVNGQYEPVINDMKVNTFRRLRFINALSQYYIQYEFPITSCNWYIIAIDGIFLNDDEVRSIHAAPYYGEYLLPSGGRLDVIVKCFKQGVYNIITTENNDNDPDLINIVRAPAHHTLFRISVSGSPFDGDDDDSTPIIEYPPKPDYLRDLRGIATNMCGCNTYFTDNTTSVVTWNEQECGVVFNMKDNHNINGVQYDEYGLPLTFLEYGQVYEFTLIPHKHVYHQHIVPFQIMDDIGYNGFQAQAGDWFDTLGGPKLKEYKFRTYPIDFVGPLVVHCHVLTHADMGMMAYHEILSPSKICHPSLGVIPAPTMYPTYSPSLNPSEGPTDGPTVSPTVDPTVSPTRAPTPICPKTAVEEVDFILLYDNSCGLSDWDCDELLKGISTLIMSLMNDTSATRIQTMEFIEKGPPYVLVDFDDTDLQNNPAVYAEFVRRKGDCTSGGRNKADLLHALHDVELYFDFLNNDRLHEVIAMNACKDYSDEICDIIAQDFDDLGITTYVVNFVNASRAENVIKPVDADNYLYCLIDDPRHMCAGNDDAGISASEFSYIIDECLLPAICEPSYPVQTPTVAPDPTNHPTPEGPTMKPYTGSPTEAGDVCFIGGTCLKTEDCCSGDIDERELGITCSCYVKMNEDRWNADVNYCCIKKGYDGCMIDEDCCKGKSVCSEGWCV